MPCEHVKLENGFGAIVCGGRGRRRRCFACYMQGGFQCDWKMGGGKTCDRFICPTHAQEVAPDKHLCPEHQEAYRAWLAARENAARQVPVPARIGPVNESSVEADGRARPEQELGLRGNTAGARDAASSRSATNEKSGAATTPAAAAELA